MKRLLACVRMESADLDGRGAFWEVEVVNAHGESYVSGPSNTLLRGMENAERIAREHGFGIQWHGLVGHGVELDAYRDRTDATTGEPA